MGGTIRVITVVDNNVYKQSRWTNPLPDYVKTDKFVKCDRIWINDYLSHYDSSAYAEKEETFSPNGYGLDVFDFDNKRILTSQGYCSYERIDWSAIYLYMAGCVITDLPVEDQTPTTTKRMFEAGMLGMVDWGMKEISLPNTFDEALKIMEETDQYRFHKHSQPPPKVIAIGFSILWKKMGWDLIQFEESKKGFKEMLDYCNKNYTLTEKDVKVWKKFIRER